MAMAICKGRHGWLCFEDQDQTIGASIQRYGEWAESEIFFLWSFIAPGAVVLDVGAHLGTHALAFARFVGREGCVIAIDAQTRAFELLALNIALNDAPQVRCVHALVGREAGYRLVAPEEPGSTNLGAVTFTGQPSREGAAPFLLPLPMLRLDDLALQRCDMVKIDIEGMEYEALLGARELLARHRPVIYFEQTRADNFAETFTLLAEAGYRLFWHVVDPFNRNNFRGAAENIFGGTREVNVLALPKEEAETRRAETAHLPPIAGPLYDPPSRQGPATGWEMPAGAYGGLPPVERGALRAAMTEAG